MGERMGVQYYRKIDLSHALPLLSDANTRLEVHYIAKLVDQ